MFTALHMPAAPLSAFVANLWSLSDTPVHRQERIVPSGTLELVINLNADEFCIHHAHPSDRCQRFSGAIVSGAYDRCFVIDTKSHASVIGVHFKPGGAFPFLGLPPGALGASHVDLETIWGAAARELRDALCACLSPTKRFQVLETELLARLIRPVSQHQAVQLALEQLQRGTPVGQVVAQVGLSHRRFIEVFTSEVGTTPKLFARLRRFQRATALAQRQISPDWSRLAAECGYFDQSHLVRDFVAFSGLAPTEFARHSTPQLKDNHLPLIERRGSNSSNTKA